MIVERTRRSSPLWPTSSHHSDSSRYFEAVSGSTPDRRREGKGAIIAHALDRLGRPEAGAVSPGVVYMVGDTNATSRTAKLPAGPRGGDVGLRDRGRAMGGRGGGDHWGTVRAGREAPGVGGAGGAGPRPNVGS